MQQQVRAPLVVAAMALVLAALAFVLLDRPETGPPLPDAEIRSPKPRAAPATRREAAGDDDDEAHHAATRAQNAAATVAQERRPRSEAEADAGSSSLQQAARTAPVELEPWDDDAEVRAQLLEEAVVTVLASVAPELGDAVLERSCDADGNLCVFEGPWPGDDFLGRWVAATGDGRFAPADLNGVTFEKFERIDHADGQRYSITAVAPK